MIGLGKSIAHTSTSMGYGWNEEKGAEVVYKENLAGENPREIAQEFKIVQQQNHLCHKNTLSFVLSPTIEDGRNLTNKDLHEVTERFLGEMKLRSRQAIGFVHRDKNHTHIHLYVNRIAFDGRAYKDNFIGKRSQLAAERVANTMGIKTVREVQQEKLDKAKNLRQEIGQLHDKVIQKDKPRNFDNYIRAMEDNGIKVIPSINRQDQLQGFRFEYRGHSLKGSEVHRSMSMGKIADKLGWEKAMAQRIMKERTVQLLGKAVGISPNLAMAILKKAIHIAAEKSRGFGIEI
ncbi:MAG TPA: relaxase/mobilization nuclease domain-containing protein [Arenibacter sp.]|nr:relaxase/mobilization nuclease domain-containing protein [Arenibacter sp.]